MKRAGIVLGAVALLGFGVGMQVQERSTAPVLKEAERQRVVLEEKWAAALKELAGTQRAREAALEELSRERSKAAKAETDLGVLQARVQELETRKEPVESVVKRQATGRPFAKMLKDPAMKEFIKGQQVAMLDMQYGKLFERFQLSPEERQDLKGLLAEKMRRELDLALAEKDPQKAAELNRKLSAVTEEMDAKIRTFLNNEQDFGVYRKWEETKAERMQLNLLGPAFSGVGEPLTIEQEEKLVDVMHTAASRGTMEGTANGFNPEFLENGISPEMGEKLLANLDQQTARVLADAAQFLSPVQVGALKQAQQNQRKMAELGMRMMTGGGK